MEAYVRVCLCVLWVSAQDEIGGLKKTVGLIINGLLTVLSLLIIVLGVIGMLQANVNTTLDPHESCHVATKCSAFYLSILIDL